MTNQNENQTEDTEDTNQCDCCDNPAVYNLQRVWIVYDINGNQVGIPDNQDPIDRDNLFLCRECAKERVDPQVQAITFGEWKSI